MQKQNTVVIVGGGFGGVTCAAELAKHIKYSNIPETKIILVDKKDYQLYYPNIYEVATSEEEFVSIAALKKSVALPLREILPDASRHIQGELTEVNQNQKYISVREVNGIDTKVNYDYLVLALGSVTDFFGIPGARENSLTLSSIADALKIRNAAEFLIQSHQMDVNKKAVRIVLGGGGFTGVELVAELLNLIEILSWKYSYPAEKIELMIIEGGNQLMPGMPAVISSTIYHRLRGFGVNIVLGKIISSVDKEQITLNNGEVVNYDLFIWTGGVKSATIPFIDKVETDRKGRALTSFDLSLKGDTSIFMVGDDACVMDADQHPMPQTATQAIFHAEYVAKAITSRITGKELENHNCKVSPFIVPVRGKWAILRLPSGFTMIGFIPWLGKIFASAGYFARFMPWSKALRLAFFEEDLYIRND